MNEIIIKKSDDYILKELSSISFDKDYINQAKDKYEGETYKLFNLKPHEANILKQICLSLGFDCAVSRDTVMCKCEYTDALLFATKNQIKKLCEKLKSQPFRLSKLADEFQKITQNKLKTLTIRNYLFDWSKPYIMGIVNVTPDSFSDGGEYQTLDESYKHSLKLIEDGADIIDIGGESTKPDAVAISADEEINRVIPLIKKLRDNNIDLPISVDTRNFETAKAALENGADIINDVSGLRDEKLLNFINQNNIPVIIMHSDSVPASSNDFTDKDIVEQIYFSLKQKTDLIISDNVIIDVGIGFGKSCETNFEILKRIEEFKTLNYPILMGLSRKSFLTKTFNIGTKEADIPTAIYSVILAKSGVSIHRVHNVKLLREYLSYASKLF